MDSYLTSVLRLLPTEKFFILRAANLLQTVEIFRVAWYNMCVKALRVKKAIALYETRMRAGWVVMTVIFYILSAVIWYALAAVLPYTATVKVDVKTAEGLTRAAFTATSAEIGADEKDKERAFLMPTSE